MLVHQYLCDDGGGLPFDAAFQKLVVQCLLNLVPDSTLGVRATRVERHRMKAGDFLRDLGPQKDKPDLRPVSMRYDNVVSLLYDFRYVACCLDDGLILVMDALVLFISNEGVSSNSDNGQSGHLLSSPCQGYMVRARIALTVCRRFSASS